MPFKYELPPGAKGLDSKEYLGKFDGRFSAVSDPISWQTSQPPVTPVMTRVKPPDDDLPAMREPECRTIEPVGQFMLVVTRGGPVPDTGPIRLNICTQIIDAGKFIEATLGALAACVAARNSGRTHWAEDLLEEKISALRLCGVNAAIERVQ